MICSPCRNGGDISAKIRTGQTPPSLGRPAAEARHALCRGGTWCDCQHAVSWPDNRLLVGVPAGALVPA